ncbi:hypothetical protein P7K49_013349 [Saguinus oedipus]|uniref:Uncharacterized protein n=1 Tax=Saguinus oedipus TaxID=9490 RepID=A0ABQ9VFP5_SAGOE|nr:hypothetical protein P7K49_013349 [Saguinus oedipus]
MAKIRKGLDSAKVAVVACLLPKPTLPSANRPRELLWFHLVNPCSGTGSEAPCLWDWRARVKSSVQASPRAQASIPVPGVSSAYLYNNISDSQVSVS